MTLAASSFAKPVRSALDLIGNTPLVELTRLDAGPCRLFAKLESQNPGGSIKDRIGLSMIEAAEKSGKLKPGGTIVEATAGNTGLGLAQVAVLKGYKLILVVPDKMAREKIQHLRALGADVRLTRSDVGKGHPDYYQDMALRIATENQAHFINQFSNPANPLAHQMTTGPEIWEQMERDVDAVVCGVGSGGTLTGLGRFFAEVSPKTQMVLADPVGSILTPLINTGKMTQAGSWIVEGIGEDFIPDNCDIKLVKVAYSISDKESIEAARELLSKEGILGGSSTGTLLAAALKYCHEQTSAKRVVTLVPDSGNKYLSKGFNDHWVAEQGLSQRTLKGNLTDLISRRFDSGATVTVGPDDTLLTAYNRMRSADVSQLPVLVERRLVGIVDESDILNIIDKPGATRAVQFATLVKDGMTAKPNTLGVNAPLSKLLGVFENNEVALVCDGDTFIGLITRIDLINHLRLNP
jgi:cystathionine beta-synthase